MGFEIVIVLYNWFIGVRAKFLFVCEKIQPEISEKPLIQNKTGAKFWTRICLKYRDMWLWKYQQQQKKRT